MVKKFIIFYIAHCFLTLRFKMEYMDGTRNTHWKKRNIHFSGKSEWLGSNLGLGDHIKIGFGEMVCERRN